MTANFFIRESKKTELLNQLSDVDSNLNYELFIATCYFNTESASELIQGISECGISLSAVCILIDRNQALRIGKIKLERWLAEWKSVSSIIFHRKASRIEKIKKTWSAEWKGVSLHAVDQGCLFHAKAYCLLSFNSYRQIVDGSLVTGSANLTGRGLTADKHGNNEILLNTKDNELLFQFCKKFCDIYHNYCIDVDKLEKFSDKDDYNFKYSLLQCGRFVYTWRDNNLEGSLSVTYKLTNEGVNQSQNHVAEDRGFEISEGNINKRYFKSESIPDHTKNIRHYGIETCLGHWIPEAVVNYQLEHDKDFKEFKDAIKCQLDRDLSGIIKEIEDDWEQLKESGLIKDRCPAKKFKNDVEDLRNNDIKLWRMFSKHHLFSLPYDFTQKTEVEELYDTLWASFVKRKDKHKKIMETLKCVFYNLDLSLITNIRVSE